jgi:hypothetical protein
MPIGENAASTGAGGSAFRGAKAAAMSVREPALAHARKSESQTEPGASEGVAVSRALPLRATTGIRPSESGVGTARYHFANGAPSNGSFVDAVLDGFRCR